jgi:hypothetical protein
MSLLPDTATFHEQVEACFVAYRGRGVSLSANDVELVDAWALAEVPIEIVARGLRKAAEAALWDAAEGQGQLRTLRSARKHVEAEIAKYAKRAAGKTAEPGEAPTEPFEVTRHKKLVSVLKKLAKAHAQLSPVAANLASRPMPTDFDAANRDEELALVLLLRALPFVERTALLREARRLVENANVMSAGARRESLRFHRAALVRHRWEVPTFW